MSEIPTAEEVLSKKFNELKSSFALNDVKDCMIEFAKLHVTAALKEASEKATVTPIDHEEISEGSFRPIWGVDDDSILNSYPLNKIK